jgi:hypothetical protein
MKEDEMGRSCSAHGGMRNVYTILVGRPEGKRPPVRPVHRRKDNIKMDAGEIELVVMDWTHVAWDREPWQTLVNTVMNLQMGYTNDGEFLE